MESCKGRGEEGSQERGKRAERKRKGTLGPSTGLRAGEEGKIRKDKVARRSGRERKDNKRTLGHVTEERREGG